MWVRLGSTDLMAGKVMFLRSNQGDKLDGNESVADSFRSDLVGFKSWSGRFSRGFFLPLTSARKNLQLHHFYVCLSSQEPHDTETPRR
ncbi:hypothetical protein TNCV_4017341 [Trichonephila clavipes]|nr:hypothetical protein TNCV_4017341 [Trichonephila clavipes]